MDKRLSSALLALLVATICLPGCEMRHPHKPVQAEDPGPEYDEYGVRNRSTTLGKAKSSAERVIKKHAIRQQELLEQIDQINNP